ncbi:hypothetical protein C8R43DRAFT_104064 [Mycena crocata]|nr:hypothetical protein C8R43DRAFT_104064 [Mycena crocata]
MATLPHALHSSTIFPEPFPDHRSSTHRQSALGSSPAAESIPPVVFNKTEIIADDRFSAKTKDTTRSACHEAKASLYDDICSDEAVLPISTERIKYFSATVVSVAFDNEAVADSDYAVSTECPRWSQWATGQFTFDYLFTLITSSMTPERFAQQYHRQYMDALFKLSTIIDSMGRMPDGSPPPSFFQCFYHLKRLFPNGLVSAEDFVGEVAVTLMVRVFAMGIVVANQAIYEQRNLNLDWEEMCGVLDFHVDAFELAALHALNGDVFDLSQNRAMYLDWLGHLGYHAEFNFFRTAQTYLRSSADVMAFGYARAFSLPHANRRIHLHPIHLPSLETVSLMLCWGLGITPFRPVVPQLDDYLHSGSHLPIHTPHLRDGVHTNHTRRPTAADILADLADECTSRLLHPLSIRLSHSSCWFSRG